MQQKRKTLFISDLHLHADDDENIHQFIRLLSEESHQVDAIYILGDLFETWIGDDDQSAFNLKIKNALSAASQKGTQLYFTHGNRDFLIGKKFANETGCKLLPAQFTADIYGTPVLLMHGDTLCTLDTNYQRARKYMHNRFLQSLFLFLPLTLRNKIAGVLRKASKEHTQQTSMATMDVVQAEVERVMQESNVQHLIHGHTHLPNTHAFIINDKKYERIVLPSWHEGGHVYEWSDDGERSLVKLNLAP